MNKKQIYKKYGVDCTIDAKVYVAPNEPVVTHVLNRGIRTLFNNDVQIFALYKKIFSQLNIVDYSSKSIYNAGDLVWFRDQNGSLWLLRCTRDNNDEMPNTLDDDVALGQSGWNNENQHLDILQFEVVKMLDSLFGEIVDEHSQDKEMHPFGKLSLDSDDHDYIGKKFLRKDMENLSPWRTTNIFPQEVYRLGSRNAIVWGYSRQYGQRVLEYDIIFKLANSQRAQPNDVFMQAATLSANDAVFAPYAGQRQNVNYQENSKYFYTSDSMDIFAPLASEDSKSSTSKVGITLQIQRNDYANTYSATITFPTAFANRDYMVFTNSMLSQAVGENKALVPSANDLVYCNKTRQSITILDITFPDSTKYGYPGYNATHGGLAANSFHCKVIGVIGD